MSRRGQRALLEALELRTLFSVPPLPIIPTGTFKVTDFGAIGDGTTDNTAAIQATIAAAVASPNLGGTVEIPSGDFLSGPITLASNINLQIDDGAELQALPMGTYPDVGNSPKHFITIKNATNIEVSGTGTLDGNGAAWWAAFDADDSLKRPRLFNITGSDTLLFRDVHLQNPAQFHLAFGNTNNVTIDTVHILTPADSPNTDGIDPAGLHYLIQNCDISVGDDDIAVKPQNSACGDITVQNCTFGTGHGVSVGGQTNLGLDGFTVSHCTFNGTTNGLRLKAGEGFGGLVTNVTYTDIKMLNVKHPIYITSWYLGGGDRSPKDPRNAIPAPADALTPIYKNIHYVNIVATGAAEAGIIYGLPQQLIDTVTFTNVRVTAHSAMKVYFANAVDFIDCKISPVTPHTFDATTSFENGPTIIQPAAISAAAAVGRPVNLNVIAGDPAGESVLSYLWAVVDGPSGVSFSENNSNSADTVAAIFGRTGTYHLRVTVTNSAGRKVVSLLTVIVSA